jgi:uncharacterized protein involved in exopolysaccharide biosynthesis
MLDKNMQNNNPDEIDLIILIKTIWKYKILYFAIIIICIALFTTYSFQQPSMYQSTATLLIISQESDPLSKYTSMLGIDSPKNIDNVLLTILNSQTLQNNVAEALIPLFKSKIAIKINENKLYNKLEYKKVFVIETLQLKKNFNIIADTSNALKLSYHHPDPQTAMIILNEYIQQLNTMLYSLELSHSKEFYKVIDAPNLPIIEMNKNLLKNILLSGIFGFALSSLILIIKLRNKI